MFHWLVKSANDKLEAYPRTLKGDLDLLENNKNLTINQQNALHITIEEKKILASIIKFGNEVLYLIQNLSVMSAELVIINKWKNNVYFRNSLLPLLKDKKSF